MRDTLSIHGDLNDVEVILAVERNFEIAVTGADA